MGKKNYYIQSKLLNFYVYANFLKLRIESSLSPTVMKKLQEQKIRSLVKAAVKHELYRKKFEEAGLDPAQVHTQEQLHKLAPLTKAEYRNLIDDAMKQDSETYRYCHKDHTSGSTGMPMHTCLAPNEYAAVVAQLLFILNKNGYRVFLDSSMDIRSPLHDGTAKNAQSLLQKFGLLRKYYASSADDPAYIIGEINRRKPDELKANKSIMHSILQYADEHDLKIHPVKYIVSSAEPMDEVTRELITKFFGANALIDIYASTEAGLIGYTMCGNSYQFHLNPAHYLYSIVDEEGRSADQGELYITNLYMKLFPMINYKQGDSVSSFVDEKDGKRYLHAVLGRSNDYLILRDGRKISYLHISPAISRYFTEIEWYRLIQEKYGELKVVMVQRKNSTRSTREIEMGLTEHLRHFVGKDLDYTFEWVDHMPVDPNDKIRVLISHVQ